jgi:hypothetical protein
MRRFFRTGNSKYGAVATVVEGIRFHSKREARRYAHLSLMLKAGAIRDLERQPRFRIVVEGRFICDYFADFRYVDLLSGEVVTEDSKGMATDVYKLKKRLVEALYPVTISEV